MMNLPCSDAAATMEAASAHHRINRRGTQSLAI
jgi:hypothetical protein